jgi:hypothetical protein
MQRALEVNDPMCVPIGLGGVADDEAAGDLYRPYKASTMAASPASECRRDSQVRTLRLRLLGIADLSFEVDELVGGD